MKLEFRQDGMQIVSRDPESLDYVVAGLSESNFGLDDDIRHGHLLAASGDMLEAIEEVYETLNRRWGHADAPYDPDMLHAIQVLSVAVAKARKTA